MPGPHALAEAFRAAGLRAGDVLMLHSDALVLSQIEAEDRAATLFQVLDEVLGPDGTLILPSFTYSATKGEVFDPAATPGTVGMLAEYFRTLPGVARSVQPIFSIAARGRRAEEFLAAPIADCFGKGSAFDLLYRHDALLACLACGFDRITFVHYVEQEAEVDYRFFKDFPARIRRAEGGEAALTVRYFVRDLDRRSETDLARLKARLHAEDRLRLVPIGRAGLTAVRAGDFYRAARALLVENPAALIREGV